MKKGVKRQLLIPSILFLFLVFALIFVYNSSSWVLSTLRAYVASESHYSKGQKDAIFHLLQYSTYHRDSDFRKYEENIKIPLGNQLARRILNSDKPDKEMAIMGYVQGGNSPEDAKAMVDLFLMFKNSEHFDDTRRLWASADTLINLLDSKAQLLHDQISGGAVNDRDLAVSELELLWLNERLTVLENSFSESLSEDARWVKDMLRWATIVATLFLVGLALIIFYKTLQNIRRSDRRYGDLFRNTRDTVFIIEPDGTLVDVNPAGIKLFGYDSFKQMISEFDIAEIYDDEAQQEELWRKLKTEGYVSSHDLILLRKDGSKIYARITAHADMDGKSGHISTIKGIIRDFTEQWKMQEELSFNTALSSKTFQESKDALFITSGGDGKIIDCNEAAVNMFEASSKEDLMGMFGPSMHKKGMSEGERQSFKEALLKHSYWSNEIVYVTNKGNEFWGNVRISKLDVHGKQYELVRIVDITERKKSEMLMQAQRNELERLNAEMNTHMSTARHELRTPLSNIRQMAQMAKDSDDADTVRKRLDMISSEAKECLRTVNGFLRFIDPSKVKAIDGNISDEKDNSSSVTTPSAVE